jgi:hypothetical protein
LVFEGVLRRDDSLLLLLFRTQVFCREKGKYKIKLLYKSWFHIACNVVFGSAFGSVFPTHRLDCV